MQSITLVRTAMLIFCSLKSKQHTIIKYDVIIIMCDYYIIKADYIIDL